MPLRLEIITAERVIFDGDVDSVVAPGGEGELGVLPQHAALMTTLLPGELRFSVQGTETYLSVTGGFMDVRGNHVVVLADAAEHVHEIDLARAEEAVQRARERIDTREEDLDLERALRSLRRAQVRVKGSRRRRGQPPAAAGAPSPSE